MANGFERDAPIHFFTVNAPKGREWQASSSWPLPQAVSTSFHLAEKSRLTKAAVGGATHFKIQYDVQCAPDFDKALQFGPYAQPCPLEQAAVHFVSAPLEKDLQLTGHPIADLSIASDAADTNVFVYLEDLAPDGSVTSITDGRQRASLRKVADAPWTYLGLPWRRSNREDVQPLEPGVPVRIKFDLLPISYIVKAGHRLRVSIAGADYRERDRDTVNAAHNITIYNTKDAPSVILLPIVSAS